MESFSDRFKQFAEYYNVSKASVFSKKTGINHQSSSNYLKGLSVPSLDALRKIKESFENLNMEWFVTGEGEMLLSTLPVTKQESKQDNSKTTALQHLLEHEKEERQKKEEELAKLYREIGKLEQQNESLAEALAKAQKEVEAKTAEMETTLIEVGKNRERIEHLEEERSRILAKLSQFTDISPFETKSAS